MKKVKGVFLYLLFIVLFFYSTGCGIPNIYIPDSYDYSFNSTYHRVTLEGDLVDNTLIRSGYPKLALFYQIIPIGASESGFSNAITYFNNTICSRESGQRILASSSQPYFSRDYSSSTYGNASYGIYQFSTTQNPTNIIGIFQSANLESNPSSVVWNLDFNYEESTGILNLTIRDSNGDILDTYPLYRYNGSSFRQNHNDNRAYIGQEIPNIFSDFESDISSYQLNVYALITVEFNDFTNIFNTTISYSSSSRIFYTRIY